MWDYDIRKHSRVQLPRGVESSLGKFSLQRREELVDFTVIKNF